jgi:abortive infection bacteriophage resistance protein
MIGDRTTMIERLSTVNYYRLSAYWYTFRTPGSEQLRAGTHFDHVWDRYVFDQQLRILVMEAIERIEVAVRTQLAYHHAHAFDAFAYAEKPTTLPGMTNGPVSDYASHASFMAEVRKCVKRSREPFVRHFRQKYTHHNDLPIWMATELMTLGTVLHLYQGCRNNERQPVAFHYGVLISEFESWLLMLNTVRNICAHHARLWNKAMAKQPSIPRHPDWNTPVKIDPTTVFAALTVCAYCLSKISPDTSWHKRVRALVEKYPSIPMGRTSHSWTMGLPRNWLDSPIWAPAR